MGLFTLFLLPLSPSFWYWAISLTVLVLFLSKLYTLIYELFLMKEKPLSQIYGENSWAVITGASEGIGWGFAEQLAKRGFNIVIISRTEKTLKEKVEFLHLNNSMNKRYEFISTDFGQGTTEAFYIDLLKKQEGKDVSILVNNVGARIGKIEGDTIEKTRLCGIVNTFPCAMLTKQFIEKMSLRSERSAIINLSSMNSYLPLLGRGLYSACKKFNKDFTYDCNINHSDKIDFQTVKPAFVSTPMNLNRKIDLFTVDIKTCAESSLKCLGNITETCGAPKHKILGFIIEGFLWVIPESIRKLLNDFIAYKIQKASKHDPKDYLKKSN